MTTVIIAFLETTPCGLASGFLMCISNVGVSCPDPSQPAQFLKCTRNLEMKLSTHDLAATPTANFVVKYKSAQTDKVLQGTVACELSERLYGADVWWVLLGKD